MKVKDQVAMEMIKRTRNDNNYEDEDNNDDSDYNNENNELKLLLTIMVILIALLFSIMIITYLTSEKTTQVTKSKAYDFDNILICHLQILTFSVKIPSSGLLVSALLLGPSVSVGFWRLSSRIEIADLSSSKIFTWK